MNRIYLVIAVSLLMGCKISKENESISTDMVINSSDKSAVTSLAFNEEVFKFGEITQGEKVDFTFEFENTGDYPLVIGAVKAACGCTLTEGWPEEPISPGEKGVIPVQFDSEGKSGFISKSINMIANTHPKTTVLYFEGTVIGPESTN